MSDVAEVGSSETVDTLDVLRRHFLTTRDSGYPKHIRVRNALVDAIRNKDLGPGSRIPAEQKLCEALSVSLGTAQRALRELSEEGTLRRETGRGTFVSESVRREGVLWQFRFRSSPGEQLLPVNFEIHEKCPETHLGLWNDVLEDDSAGYIRIVRTASIGEHFRCHNEAHLGRSRFGDLMHIAVSEDSMPLKTLLAKHFDAPTISVRQFARAAPIPTRAASILELPEGLVGTLVLIVGQSYGRRPIFLQTIWMPAGPYLIDLSHDDALAVSAGHSGEEPAERYLLT